MKNAALGFIVGAIVAAGVAFFIHNSVIDRIEAQGQQAIESVRADNQRLREQITALEAIGAEEAAVVDGIEDGIDQLRAIHAGFSRLLCALGAADCESE